MGTVNPYRKQMLDAGLPDKAWQRFKRYYVPILEDLHSLEIVADPYVEGTYAVRVTVNSKVTYSYRGEEKTIEYVEDYTIMWSKDDWDEVEFESWPPQSEPNSFNFFS